MAIRITVLQSLGVLSVLHVMQLPREYLPSVVVEPDSKAVGATITDTRLAKRGIVVSDSRPIVVDGMLVHTSTRLWP